MREPDQSGMLMVCLMIERGDRNEASGERREAGQNMFKDDSERAKKVIVKKLEPAAKKVGYLI